jgi:TonB family protein
LSPSHAADPHADPAQLHGLDFLVSVAVHALIVGIIVALAMWEVHRTPKPLSRLQVSMITQAQLDRMIRHAAKARPHAKPKPRAHARPKPAAPISHPASPHAGRTKQVAKARAKPEQPFDPFAPLESKDDRTTAPTHTQHNALANMQMQQLSKQEINRYIAMIQTAVQQHWKVPLSLGPVHNPLVELKLNPDGSVASISILESSGDAALDASLSRAIEAAAPFQLPAKQFEVFRDNRIRFVPEVNQQP